nr:BolA family protein [Oleiagrimonas soli]
MQPQSLEVLDEGHLHVGHAGEGQGHYRVRITSAAFAGLLPLKRHRLVYDAVGSLMGDGIHALAIEAHAPGEAAAHA